VRTLKTFQGTHILGASRGLLCDSYAVLFITKSALEITSAIGEKLRPVALTKEKISLMRKLVAMHTH